MKKILLFISLFLIIFVACDEKTEVIEPEVTKNSINFPFESMKNGKFIAIYRNNLKINIPITFAMAKQGEVMEDSQNYDFCPDILNLRNGIANPDWFLINFNYPIIAEDSVLNKNDHPNLISYSLPKGTYIALLMDSDECNKDQYAIFDITTNDALDMGIEQ